MSQNTALIISGNMTCQKAGDLFIQLPMVKFVFLQSFWNGWITKTTNEDLIIEPRIPKGIPLTK